MQDVRALLLSTRMHKYDCVITIDLLDEGVGFDLTP